MFLQTTQHNMTQTQAPEMHGSPDKCVVSLANYRPFFRELDINVFTILHTWVVTDKVLDTDMNTKVWLHIKMSSIYPPSQPSMDRFCL